MVCVRYVMWMKSIGRACILQAPFNSEASAKDFIKAMAAVRNDRTPDPWDDRFYGFFELSDKELFGEELRAEQEAMSTTTDAAWDAAIKALRAANRII